MQIRILVVDDEKETGDYLQSADDVRSLGVGAVDKRPVRVSDIAQVVDGPPQPVRYVWTASGPAGLAAAAILTANARDMAASTGTGASAETRLTSP